MLVLSRRVGEEIIINNNIKVTIVAVKGDRIRLGIVAPKDVTVDRAEIHERRNGNGESTGTAVVEKLTT